VRAARERIVFDTTAWHARPTTTPRLETLRAAVWNARRLDVLYPRSDGQGTAWRRVEPYGLACKAGTWYLVGYCHMRRDFRTFRVSRIADLSVRDEAVKPRPDFDLHAYWAEARQRFEQQTKPLALTLRLSPRARSRAWDGYTIRQEPDGAAVVRVDTESVEAAVAYALSLGATVIVLDPPAVRDAVATAARELAALYAEAPAVSSQAPELVGSA